MLRSATNRPPIYEVCPADKLVWAHWEADSSLYHRGTAETHLLSPLPTEIVRTLERGPLTLTELSAVLAGVCETPDSADWQDKLGRILGDLMALEIVDRRDDED